ncbi:alpha/beta hydrolase [Limnospira fusiformis KN01]|uniref:Phospholipase/Carboxylesterase n=2 Tax=Limnospira TaxID=2596745 RepID=B5W9H4_LIMMA|nr:MULTISPECIES: alpha/beta hydrolase [Limnospira]MDC0836922.1 alpha/beta hydrolase [Limnoraphis robusta]EDZ91825.1 phospholipase/Carboxylesterase [Limnospira maxima CS-328]MDT9190650.1 alpha/beta hydrolase [Limnospira sp. PMC 894.15]MDT9236595.1 alpha/beta hydrolase [Limnospira sp. PMC 917.15]MDT9277423.1 alpha/beta hydrolase [Limnospira sp. PMC 737.11]
MSLHSYTVKSENPENPEGLIIFLHGWGANCEDLTFLAPMLRLPNYWFEFPEAPFPHPQVPGGRAWYALETQEYEGIEESREKLIDWLNAIAQTTGIPPQRTILGGFSQGGAMTFDVGRTMGLAGLIVLSGYLHFKPEPQQTPLPPILMAHGKQDMVVPLGAAHQARDSFQKLGATVEYHEYNMGHEICPDILGLIQSFVIKTLPNNH